MKTVWTASVKDRQVKEDIKASFKASTVVRRRLKEMCQGKVESSFSLSKDSYDCPNWTYKQADTVGYQRALKEIMSLLD